MTAASIDDLFLYVCEGCTDNNDRHSFGPGCSLTPPPEVPSPQQEEPEPTSVRTTPVGGKGIEAVRRWTYAVTAHYRSDSRIPLFASLYALKAGLGKDDQTVRLSDTELAEMTGTNRQRWNGIRKRLIEDGFLRVEKPGRPPLTRLTLPAGDSDLPY